MMSRGRRVRADIRAITIARPVNKPKYILGIKLENISIEKPIIMVTEV